VLPIALLGCLAFAGSAISQDRIIEQTWNCSDPNIVRDGKLPIYSIGHRDHAPGEPKTLSLQLSVSPRHADSSADLVLLACKLASDFSKETAIDALIFDDNVAAKNLAHYATDQANWGEYIWHLRAHYTLNRRTGQQWLDWVKPTVDPANETILFTLQKFRISIPLDK
jgi:hypothetical protein